MSLIVIYGDFEVWREKLSTLIGYAKNNEQQATKQMSKIIEQKVKYKTL